MPRASFRTVLAPAVRGQRRLGLCCVGVPRGLGARCLRSGLPRRSRSRCRRCALSAGQEVSPWSWTAPAGPPLPVRHSDAHGGLGAPAQGGLGVRALGLQPALSPKPRRDPRPCSRLAAPSSGPSGLASPVTSDAHLFARLLAIRVSDLEKSLFKSWAYPKIWLCFY